MANGVAPDGAGFGDSVGFSGTSSNGVVRRVEVISGTDRRRLWSKDDKARIIAESLVPGVNVSAVARRHGLHPNQLFKWRTAAGHRPTGKTVGSPQRTFVPVVAAPAVRSPASQSAPVTSVIEVLTGSVIIRLDAGADPAILHRVLEAARRFS